MQTKLHKEQTYRWFTVYRLCQLLGARIMHGNFCDEAPVMRRQGIRVWIGRPFPCLSPGFRCRPVVAPPSERLWSKSCQCISQHADHFVVIPGERLWTKKAHCSERVTGEFVKFLDRSLPRDVIVSYLMLLIKRRGQRLTQTVRHTK